MTGRSKNPTSTAARLVQQTQALHLRAHGHTYRGIAKALSCSLGQAHQLVDRAIAEERKSVAAAKADLIALEVTRCDIYLAAIAKKVQAGDTKAVDTALRVADRRAKLLGLDAPSKSVLGTVGEDGDETVRPIGIGFVAAPSMDDIPPAAREALESFRNG